MTNLTIPCGHDGTDAGCSLCRVFRTHDDYNRLWGGPGVVRAPLSCRHKGDETRRIICPTCSGKVELKVFSCVKFGECTTAKRADGVKGCCADGCSEP